MYKYCKIVNNKNEEGDNIKNIMSLRAQLHTFIYLYLLVHKEHFSLCLH